jgi:hypothetical protein
VINPVYALQEEALARLSLAEISAGSPWRAAEAQAEAQAAWQAAAPPLPAQEQADVRALFAPLGPLLAGTSAPAPAAEAAVGALAPLAPQVQELVERLQLRLAEAPAVPHLPGTPTAGQ